MRTARSRRTGTITASLLAAVAVVGALASAAHATPARTSLPVIERQVMCVTCKIPLNVAESTQADRERAYIRGLIEAGDDEAQVKNGLVGQYGPAVLGLPPTHGFDLVAYLVPLAAVLGLCGLLALLLPRWRRAARDRTHPPADTQQPIDPVQSARLESDMARFE